VVEVNAPFVIAVRGCQHLGYDATGFRRNRNTGWGGRVVDGHVAHELGARSMIEHAVNYGVDGGDIFHWSRPMPRDIEVAHRVDDLLHAAVRAATRGARHGRPGLGVRDAHRATG
jgi:hypothetical protein